ncbi:MAG TPA: ATP-binding protein, partial [Verrucomicrobiae bacterium]|nr:ATP-binding protein [Verrucomicrobiae bacterium]
LIDDLLDLTRIGSGKLSLERKNIIIHDLLKTTLQMLQGEFEAKKLALKLNDENSTGVVLGDPVRLQQIFWNVLKNAIKFTGPNGTITVATHCTKREFKLVVTDTGIGMTKEELQRAFNAFRQEASPEMQRFGGLGLGLTIGKSLVELHQGTIEASSQGRNYGSTITIILPLVQSLAEVGTKQETPLPQVAQKALPPWKILLVEDHDPTRNTLAALLTKRKFLVQQASSVAESISLAAKEHFDVVISDVGLPDGNGIDLFSNLRRLYPKFKGIALTGYGSQDDIDRSIHAGFNAHLTKPVRIEALEMALSNLANVTTT